MVRHIRELLEIGEYYGCTEYIDIAKGKYKLCETFKEGMKHRKRLRNGNGSIS